MAIAAKDVMNLRKATGLGMMECKAALEETDGDMGKAKDLLRQRGLAKMDGRADREALEGRVIAAVSADKTKAVIVEINSETDFTANNEAFTAMAKKVVQLALEQPVGAVTKTDAMQAAVDEVRLTTKENIQFRRGQVVGGAGSIVGSYVHFTGKTGSLVALTGSGVTDELLSDLCMHIVAASPAPLAVKDQDIDANLVAKEREIAKAQALDSGKPANIAEKIVDGKMRKFFEDHVLPKQLFVKDDKKRIQDVLPKGVTIADFARYVIGG
ncbi:MAG: translation elongation factor Ts [Phycisphaeraceae bacterium]|nr:translation elongation factor Ts [Phycisphaeraceae bacterium]